MFRTILFVCAALLAGPALAHQHEGAVAVTEGFARATLPNAPVGGIYLTLTNQAGTDDRLLAVSSPAGDASIHDMSMQGDVIKMMPLPDGVALPAGQAVTFGPSGKHIMLDNLSTRLVEGETVELTLTFEHAAPLTVEVPVAAINADAAPMHHHH